MKRKKRMTALFTACALLCGSLSAIPQAIAAESVTFSGITGLPFTGGDPFKGVDLSSVISLENSGVKFRGRSGNEQDVFVTLAEAGVNCVRVRIWNDPYEPGTGKNYGGGVCDVECAKKIAVRCAKAGLSLLVDFHYSDFWADPGKQKAPKAWNGHSIAQKCEDIYAFTSETLQALAQTGVNIAMVQVGNETTTGMCGVMLADYNWSEQGWGDLCSLFSAGAKAVRDFSRDTLVALHFTNPEKASNMAYIAKNLAQNHVDYDVFATSYYPYWHGTLQNLREVLTSVAQTYDKKVLVAETSWVRTFDDADGFANTVGSRDKLGSYVSYEVSTAGQSAYLHDLFQTVAAVPDGKGIGVFYWEPAWLPVGSDGSQNRGLWEQYGSGWGNAAAGDYDRSARDYAGGSCVENESLFSADGVPLDSLYVFSTIHGSGETQNPQETGENLLKNPGFEADGGWTDRPQGWTLRATADAHFDVRAEDVRSGKAALHWYSEGQFSGSTAVAQVQVPESGRYRFSVHLQADESTRFTLSAARADGTAETLGGTGKGWAVWQAPYVEIDANAGETLTLTVTVDGGQGSFGSVDDCALVLCEQPPAETEPPVQVQVTPQMLRDYLIAAGALSEEEAAAADLDHNGRLNAADLTLMKRRILLSR